MKRLPEDATIEARIGSPSSGRPGGIFPDTREGDVSIEEQRDTARRGELVFPKEADTLTAHTTPILRRTDTLPLPPIGLAQDLSATAHDVDDAPVEHDEAAGDDDTQTEIEPYEQHEQSDDPTSPTLALANRSDSTREVYRLFLASEYAPALELVNELIAQGEDDAMLVTIARECRSSLASETAATRVSAPPVPSDRVPRQAPVTMDLRAHLRPPEPPVRPRRPAFTAASFDAKMTIGQVAAMTGMSVEQVLRLLERFVSMGVLTVRPPR